MAHPRWIASPRKLLAALFVGVLLAGEPVHAQVTTSDPQSAPTGAAHVYEAGELNLDSSRVFVRVNKTGLGHEHGVMGQIRQGVLRLDAAQNPGRIVFDMASFVADTDLARRYVGLEGATDASTQQQVTTNMLGEDVLDVRRFPTAIFEIHTVQKLPQPSQRNLPQFQLDGDFTLHGATRPIRVVAEAEQRGGWIHLRGGFAILQSQFGMKPFTKAFGAIGVADRLEIYGDLWIAQQRAVVSRTASRRNP